MAKTGLLIVDVQNDFITGSLAVENGGDVVPHIVQLLDAKQGWSWAAVVASMDYHPEGHISFATSHRDHENDAFQTIRVTDSRGREIEQILWPEHCIQGTSGYKIEELVFQALQLWRQQDRFHLIHKGTDIDMDAYSAFATPSSPTAADSAEPSPLTTYLRSKGITKLVICGIATDVCVKATARDALQQGFEIILVEDAVKGVNLDESNNALQQLGQHPAATIVKDIRSLIPLIRSV